MSRTFPAPPASYACQERNGVLGAKRTHLTSDSHYCMTGAFNALDIDADIVF